MITSWQFNGDASGDYLSSDFLQSKISRVHSIYPAEYIEDREPLLLNLDAPNWQNAENQLDSMGSVSSAYKKLNSDKETGVSMQWQNKRVEDWRVQDTRSWLLYATYDLNIPYRTVSNSLPRPGNELAAMTLAEFKAHDPANGEELYRSLCEYRRNFVNGAISTSNIMFVPKTGDESSQFGSNCSYLSDRESDNSIESTIKPRGSNPKRKTTQRQVKLWEFVRNLLLDRKYCPHIICWEKYKEAKFRFVRSGDVAKLWGKRKGNATMNYEKFSRALRYYYQKKIFLAVAGQRLVYQFGENAKGWQTDNPNFENENKLF